jgi:hypothetical protein
MLCLKNIPNDVGVVFDFNRIKELPEDSYQDLMQGSTLGIEGTPDV